MSEIAVPVTGSLAIATDGDQLAHYVAAWLLGYRSSHTRTAYARDVTAYAAWCADNAITVLTATRGHANAYARTMEDAGRAPATVARTLSAIGSLYGYLVAEDVLTRSPLVHVRRPPTASDSQTTGLDRDECRALLAAADSESLRTRALLRLLVGNGLRVAEVIGADASDLAIERGHQTLAIVRKGGRRATVPLAPPVAAATGDYLAGRTDGPLFATSTGRRMDEPSILRLVRRVAKAAGIASAGRLSPHSLRHTFVTLALDAGVSLRDVQDAAGHADPRTTRRYDRGRHSLDRHAAYALAQHLAA